MKQILFAIGLSLLFLVNANAQYTPNRSTAWWEQAAPSLDNVFGSTIGDSTLTLLIISADGDTVGIRGQFQFWRNGRYVPQDSLYTIAQIISYVTGLGYATQTWAYQSKDSSLVPVTLGSGAFIMGNIADGWYEIGLQPVLDTLAAKGSLNMTQMAELMSGESGTGNVVMSTNAALTTPNLGTPSALTLTNATGLPTSGITDGDKGDISNSSGTLTIDDNVVDYAATSGSYKSLTPVTDDADNFAANFTGANLYGGTFVANGTGTIVLPAVTAGMNFTIITLGAIAVVIDPNASDLMITDGVAGADGENITNLSTAGDIAVVQYLDATGWLVTTNGWTQE